MRCSGMTSLRLPVIRSKERAPAGIARLVAADDLFVRVDDLPWVYAVDGYELGTSVLGK